MTRNQLRGCIIVSDELNRMDSATTPEEIEAENALVSAAYAEGYAAGYAAGYTDGVSAEQCNSVGAHTEGYAAGVAAERERCANVLLKEWIISGIESHFMTRPFISTGRIRKSAAAAIRAGGENETN